MAINLTITDLSAEEAQALIALLTDAPTVTVQSTAPAAHPAPAPRPAPVPTAALVPPPPTQAPAPAPADPLMAAATKAMTAYIGVHKVTGARKVLQQVGHTKISEVTDPAHLNWLVQAFSDLTYIPPG